jgi:hypothetical protein
MLTYGADMVVIGIFMGIVFMTCAVVILTTIYALRRGLGKTNLWLRKQHELQKAIRVASSAEPVMADEPIEEAAHPPDFGEDAGSTVFTYMPSKASPVSVPPPAEEKQAAVPSPDISSPEPEAAASHQEPIRVNEARPEQSKPVSDGLFQSEKINLTKPIGHEASSVNQVAPSSKSGQEAAAELKSSKTIPQPTPEAAVSHQAPIRVNEARPEQSKPVSAGLFQSEKINLSKPIGGKAVSVTKVVPSRKSGQEAAKLKASETIPQQTPEAAASHQEPIRVNEARPEQPEPVGAEPVQSESVEPEARSQVPPEKAEDKGMMGDLSELFSEEILEENDTGQLADNLNEVDISHLIADARSLLDDLKKYESDNSS